MTTIWRLNLSIMDIPTIADGANTDAIKAIVFLLIFPPFRIQIQSIILYNV